MDITITVPDDQAAAAVEAFTAAGYPEVEGGAPGSGIAKALGENVARVTVARVRGLAAQEAAKAAADAAAAAFGTTVDDLAPQRGAPGRHAGPQRG